VGEITVIAYAALAALGLALVGWGAFRRHRFMLRCGAAILLALAGAWVLGPAGLAAGVLPFVLGWRPVER